MDPDTQIPDTKIATIMLIPFSRGYGEMKRRQEAECNRMGNTTINVIVSRGLFLDGDPRWSANRPVNVASALASDIHGRAINISTRDLGIH